MYLWQLEIFDLDTILQFCLVNSKLIYHICHSDLFYFNSSDNTGFFPIFTNWICIKTVQRATQHNPMTMEDARRWGRGGF